MSKRSRYHKMGFEHGAAQDQLVRTAHFYAFIHTALVYCVWQRHT
eukprot:SAG31_NODE_26809_length_436_cov_0.759644_1_plen_44_part_01